MPRFELSISSGEKIVIDHAAQGMAEFIAAVDGKEMLLLTEITGASTGAAREIVVTRGQITLVRALGNESTQGSNFRPKR